MKVGSRWLLQVSAEISKRYVLNRKIQQLFKQNRIVKCHNVDVEYILECVLPHNYKIIGIVRNPRDRLVSWAFHFYNNSKYNIINEATSDLDAIKLAIVKNADSTKH